MDVHTYKALLVLRITSQIPESTTSAPADSGVSLVIIVVPAAVGGVLVITCIAVVLIVLCVW